MSETRIRTAYQRNKRALELRPSKGLGTATSVACLTDGLTCQVTDGPWRLQVDMPAASGGTDSAPSPGVYGRAALAGCLAVCYAQMAAVEGVPLDDIEVRVEADYDARGETGFADVPARYTRIRVAVSLTSPAPEDDIQRVVRLAESHSSYLDIFRHPVEMERRLEVRTPEATT